MNKRDIPAPVLKRNIAITDLEATGLDFHKHEIIEIGLVLVDPKDLSVMSELDVKVMPQHIETADPKAIEINGYKESDWSDAVSLKEAIDFYVKKSQGAIFCAHNPTFDRAFMDQAFLKTGRVKEVKEINNLLDYHCIDIFSLAWGLLKDKKLEKYNLSYLARYLKIKEEPFPHRAINGARLAYEVYKKLMSI